MAKLHSQQIILFFTFLQCILFDFQAYAVPYDYSFTSECLANPLKPQYDGGVVVNPELNEGLKGWTSFGDVLVKDEISTDDNKYVKISNRNESFHSVTQTFNLEKEKLYTFSAWLQVSNGTADIAAMFSLDTKYEIAGWVSAQQGCWSMLKGGLVVNASGPYRLYFDSKNTEVDIWVDSISLQPFTDEEWTSHQRESVEQVRKTKVRFQAVDQHGRPIPNATVSVKQSNSGFPVGCAINRNILNNRAYQSWFSSRFRHTVFENELKWYSTERSRGSEDYSTSDALVGFARSRGVSIRGHNVFWNDQKYQPNWVPGLSSSDLYAAANKRIYSVMNRYKGQLFHWDVVNENVHFNFLESKLGPDASNAFYKTANRIDGRTTPFLNDFNTIEQARDFASSPAKYLQRIGYVRKSGYNGPLGIGLEGHFGSVNLAYTRSAIDILSSARLPIWVTELDVSAGPNQASDLGRLLYEIHSHRAVQGIVLWAAWSPQGCYRMCLTDNNFRNLATGNVVDAFRRRNAMTDDFSRTTDSNGFAEGSLHHGEYDVEVAHPDGTLSQKIEVVPQEKIGNTTTYRFSFVV